MRAKPLDKPPHECDDYLMTNNLTARDIATIAHRSYFAADLTDRASLDIYINELDLTSSPFLRDRLIAMLDLDIADLLHNSNTADLIPAAASLADDDFDELTDRLLDDNDFLQILADLILADLLR